MRRTKGHRHACDSACPWAYLTRLVAALVTVSATVLWMAPLARAATAAGAEQPHELTVTCPGPQCPYAPPTSTEQGAANDIMARINLERAALGRAYVYDGTDTPLSPLTPAGPTADETAQAAAEQEAEKGYVADYVGSGLAGYIYTTGETRSGRRRYCRYRSRDHARPMVTPSPCSQQRQRKSPSARRARRPGPFTSSRSSTTPHRRSGKQVKPTSTPSSRRTTVYVHPEARSRR